MPIIKSAQKRMRQTIKRRDLNIVTKKQMRDSIKAVTAAIAEKDTAKISENLRQAQSAIDTAVKKNILHKNTAARKKANLSAKAKAAGAKPASAPAKQAATKTTKPAAKTTAKKTTPKAKK